MSTTATTSPPSGSWSLSPFFARADDAPQASAGARAVRARLRTPGRPKLEPFFVDTCRDLGTPWDDAPAVTR
jgi:hypothetical protein